MKLAFIIDPIHQLDPGHDSSVAMMEAAQALGHKVWVTTMNQLYLKEGKTWAFLQPVQLDPVQLVEGLWVAPPTWYHLGDRVTHPLDTMDGVLMRQDPPVTIPYLYATYLLDYVDPKQTRVLNHPQGIRAANEKLYALQFQEVMPATIVSQDKQTIRDFITAQGKGVLKPLGGKAGEGILLLDGQDRNFNSLIEISTRRGQEPVMVQEYLPAAQDGDKRIILLDGEPIGAVNRIPRGAEFRGNMATGGRVAQTEITDRDHYICEQVAPALKRDGLYFVGIDVIGGHLTEVNVTSPTGIREIDRLEGTQLGVQVMQWLEQNPAH